MRIVRTVGQAFDVCHQLTLQQQSEDKEEEEEGKVEESDAVPGCSSKHTHTHTSVLLLIKKTLSRNTGSRAALLLSPLSCSLVSKEEARADRDRPGRHHGGKSRLRLFIRAGEEQAGRDL